MDQDAQIGRFGTISLLKKTPGDNTVITSFGIDTEELTFGRDPQCSVRLYYPDVSPVHCKIVFQERKAFLVVQGVTGVLIDGCEVYPPTTIPLANNSVFEIRKKRFQFIYPPKELRAQLFATPPRPQGRALRLSMIHTAEVFSPRPSHDPRENLRVLQSPLKPRAPQGEYAGNNVPPIILVDGNHPRVVEEDRDLVILEDVQVRSPQLQPQPPHRARSTSRHSLHRAVLIRSAQRAILQQEEEELEELEVLDVVAEPIPGLQARTNTQYSDEDEDEDQEMDLDEDGLSDEDDESEDQNTDTSAQQKSTWRKSLERIWPFRSSSQTPAEVSDNEEASGDIFPSSSEPEDDPTPRKPQPQRTPPDSDEEAELHPESMPAPETPVRRALGSFMTPQVQSSAFIGNKRYSMGGGEPQRVPIEENKWRVQDIVVPLKSPAKASALTMSTSSPALKSKPVGRFIVDDAERKAIQERRRSAIRTSDTFPAGAAPGMSPSKPRGSISPTKKNVPIPPSLREEEEEEEKMNTRSLLERMKETVEGMKRRRTSVFGSAGTPLLATGPPSPERPVAIGIDGPAETKDNETTTDPSAPQGGSSDDEPSNKNDDGFSLLRPPGFGIGMTISPAKVQNYELDPTAPHADTIPSASPIREILEGQPEQNPEVAEPEDALMQDGVPEEKLAITEPPETAPASSDANLDVFVDVPVVPARRTTRKTTAEPESEGRSADSAAIRRGRKPASIVPPTARKTRKATVEPQEEEPVAPPPAPPRRGRKPTVEPQPEPAEESGAPARRGRKLVADPPEAPAVTPAPARRGRKATAEPAESIPLPDIPAPAKRSGRRTPAESATPAARTTAKTPKSAPAAVRRGTRGKPIEVEVDEGVDDDDPLDTIDADPTVKEEETDEPAVAPKRGRSAAKARTKAPDDTSKIPTRSRSARKIVVPDKEASTPAAESDDEAPDGEAEKVRVSRSKKPAARGKLTKVKEEVGDGPKEIGRVTRTVARTRTKTS